MPSRDSSPRAAAPALGQPAQQRPRRQRLLAVLAGVWLVGLPWVYFVPWDLPDAPFGPAEKGLGWPPFGLLGPSVAAAVLFLAVCAAGSVVVRRLLPSTRGLLRGLLALAFGTGLAAACAAGLAAIGLLSRPALLLLTPLPLLLAATRTRAVAELRSLPALRAPRRPQGGLFDVACWLLLGWAAVFALAGALGPEVEFDALWYHLALPDAWLRDGTLTDFPCQYVSAYPLTLELLYAYGLALGGETTAKLVHFGFGVALVVSVYDVARRLFGCRAALAAAVVCATAPTVLWEATTAYVDLAAGFFVVLAVDVALLHLRTPSRRTVVACGLLLGLAGSIKLLALLAAPGVAMLVVLGPLRRAIRARSGDGVVLTALTVAVTSPWLLRAEVLTGNPVFPTLYSVFGADRTRWSASSDAGLQAFMDRFGRGHDLEALALLPWNLTLHGASFGGAFGVLPLLFIPFAVQRRPRRETLLLVATVVVYVLLWFSPWSSQQARFLLPAFALTAPLAGAGLDRLATGARRRSTWCAGAVLAVFSVCAALSLPPGLVEHDRVGYSGWLTHVVRETPVDYLLGQESRDAYLGRKIRSFAADRAAERLAGGATRVLAFAEVDSGVRGVEHVPAYARCLDPVRDVGSDGDALRALEALGIRHVLWDVRERDRPQDLVVADRGFERRHLRLVHLDANAMLFSVRSRS